MNRREFCGLALLPLLAQGAGSDDEGLEQLNGVSILRVSGFRHEATRRHVAGKDASHDVRGERLVEDVLRIETDAGIEGFGVGTATPEVARGLVGKSLGSFWTAGLGVVSPLGTSDQALYDLIGKVLERPVSTILGGAGADWVSVCDGSVDFNDLLPAFNGRSGVRRLLQEVEASLKSGYRAFTIKVGRGHRWMEAEAGFRRDVEVVKGVRALVGPKVRLVADGGDGFDLETTERWLDAVGNELFLVASMFPEQVERDLLLKDYLRKKKWPTLVGDGVSAADLDDLETLIAHKALDVYQPDARRWGITRLCLLARRLARSPQLQLAPRNGGSFLGFYLQLTVGRAVPNFLMAEVEPATSDLFDTSAYVASNGKIRVPNVKGFGLTLRDDVFRSRYAKDAWVVS